MKAQQNAHFIKYLSTSDSVASTPGDAEQEMSQRKGAGCIQANQTRYLNSDAQAPSAFGKA